MPRNFARALSALPQQHQPVSGFLSHMTEEELASRIASYAPSHWRMADMNFPGIQMRERFSSLDSALKVSGADFEVAKCPLMGVLSGDQAIEIKGKAGLYRTDNLESLGVASDAYGLIQNREAFGAAGVLAERREFDIRAVQVVDGGARVRLTGLLGASTIAIPDRSPDVLMHYGMFEAAHDGIHATLGALDTIRVACLNGNTARVRGNSFRTRHTSKAADRNKEAQLQLLKIQSFALEEVAMFQHLALRPMSTADYRAFAKRLLDEVLGELDEETTERKAETRKDDLAELETLFVHGSGNRGETSYDAYNSVTEWVTARRQAGQDAIAFAKKFESATTGYTAKYKERALRMLTR